MSRALIYAVERRDYLFYVRASIGANDRQPKVVRLLIDTGARRTVLPKYLLREFGCNVVLTRVGAVVDVEKGEVRLKE